MKNTALLKMCAFGGVVCCLIGLLCSCGTNLTLPTEPLRIEAGKSPHVSPVRLGPGDELEIKFFQAPELDVTITVRPDGKIILPRISEVTVTGLTPEELRGTLKHEYSTKGGLTEPEITVMVRGLARNRIYVGGEVRRPGMIELTGELTMLQSIIEAGGFINRSAKPSHVVLMRREEGKWYGATFDMRPVMKGEESDYLFLQPMDIVYVPRNAIDKVNQFVDQYISGMLPRIGFSSATPTP